ncbi:MAG: 2Fe-2S iron-sulfur cluster-binding protein [Syntrophobacteraceae bacterium]
MPLLSRRDFLKLLGDASALIAGGLFFQKIPAAASTGRDQILFTVNGQPVQYRMKKPLSLLDYLRTELGLTGTKYGCGRGVCGACTVLVQDRPVRSPYCERGPFVRPQRIDYRTSG